MKLQSELEVIQEAGIQLVGISYDSVETLRQFSAKKKIRFPLLSDKESRVIRDYGILNREVVQERFKGIPHPGTFIINQDGVIVEKLFYEGYKKRHGAAELVRAVSQLRAKEDG